MNNSRLASYKVMISSQTPKPVFWITALYNHQESLCPNVQSSYPWVAVLGSDLISSISLSVFSKCSVINVYYVGNQEKSGKFQWAL